MISNGFSTTPQLLEWRRYCSRGERRERPNTTTLRVRKNSGLKPAAISRLLAKDGQVESAQTRRITEDVALHDFPGFNREGHDQKRRPPRKPRNNACRSVHQHWLYSTSEPRELPRLLRHRPCAANHRHGSRASVRSVYNIWIEHGEKRVEVTAAHGCEKGINNFSLAAEMDIGNWSRFPHPTARTARELPGSNRRTPYYGSNLVKGYCKHAVQHECQTFGRSQRFEHDKQREPDRVGQQRFTFRVDPVFATQNRIWHARVKRVLSSRLSRAQHVQANASDDCRQPSAEIFDVAGIGAVEPQPCFLDRIVCLIQRAEHPVGHRPQVTSVFLKFLCQPILFFHRSHSLVALRHSS